MILDALPPPDFPAEAAQRMEMALDYLRGFDPTTPDGRHPLLGDEVFALVQRYETGPATAKRFESHRRHLDVQWLAEGEERILHAPVAHLVPAGEYDPEGDVLYYEEPGQSSSLLLRPGDVAVFHPGDGHKPGCMAGGRHRVRKVVVKIRIAP